MKTKNIQVISPAKGWQALNLKPLWEYRDLFYFLLWRDIKTRYAQSVLGVGWAILQPVFNMIIMTIIFGKMVKVSSDGIPYPIFSYTALVPWHYFSGALSGTGTSLSKGASMLSKIYFPRLILPLTAALGKLVDFFIAFTIVIALMIWYKVLPTYNIVFIPLFILIMFFTACGIGMWVTCLGMQFRDVNYSLGFFISALMYMTPIIYPLSRVPPKYHTLVSLNPLTGVIEGFRASLLGSIGTCTMPWVSLMIGSASAIVFFISGLFYFQRQEKIFADVL